MNRFVNDFGISRSRAVLHPAERAQRRLPELRCQERSTRAGTPRTLARHPQQGRGADRRRRLQEFLRTLAEAGETNLFLFVNEIDKKAVKVDAA